MSEEKRLVFSYQLSAFSSSELNLKGYVCV